MAVEVVTEDTWDEDLRQVVRNQAEAFGGTWTVARSTDDPGVLWLYRQQL